MLVSSNNNNENIFISSDLLYLNIVNGLMFVVLRMCQSQYLFHRSLLSCFIFSSWIKWKMYEWLKIAFMKMWRSSKTWNRHNGYFCWLVLVLFTLPWPKQFQWVCVFSNFLSLSKTSEKHTIKQLTNLFSKKNFRSSNCQRMDACWCLYWRYRTRHFASIICTIHQQISLRSWTCSDKGTISKTPNSRVKKVICSIFSF